MRRRLLKWIACPICTGTLELLVKEATSAVASQADYDVIEAIEKVESVEQLEEDVLTGALTCGKCRLYYPVYRGIPRLLTYSTAVAKRFVDEHAVWISQRLEAFGLPSFAAPPGEEAALRNFSTEWTGYEWTGDSYWATTPENIMTCMR